MVTKQVHALTAAFSLFKHNHPSTSFIYIWHVLVGYLAQSGSPGVTPGPSWAGPYWAPLGPHGPGPNRPPIGPLVQHFATNPGLPITYFLPIMAIQKCNVCNCTYIYAPMYIHVYMCHIYICMTLTSKDVNKSDLPTPALRRQ